MATKMVPAQTITRAFDIQRVDSEARTVTGYCYVTADCGDGFILPRDVMERATADYMQWANVREMHGKRAVGTAVVEWDETGALMTARISDDDAWKKVEEGVYKAFSVGVKPKKVKRADQGKYLVDDAVWFETSIVDRPADPESAFTIDRVDDADGATDMEVEDEEATPAEDATPAKEEETPAVEERCERWNAERGALADKIKESEPVTLARQAWSVLDSFIWGLFYGDPHASAVESEIRAAFDDVRDYVAPLLAKADVDRSAAPSIARMLSGDDRIERLEAENALARARAEKAEAELKRFLDTTPDPAQAKPQAVTATHLLRQFADSVKPDASKEEKQAGARTEIARILDALTPESSEDARMAAAAEIDRIKRGAGL